MTLNVAGLSFSDLRALLSSVEYTKTDKNEIEVSQSDLDDFAKENGFGAWYVVTYKRFGNERIEPLFYNWLTNEWEDSSIRKCDIIDDGGCNDYSSVEEAQYAIDANENELKALYDNADEEVKGAYKEYCNYYIAVRNRDYGWAKRNNNMNTFRAIHGNGEPLEFHEWLERE